MLSCPGAATGTTCTSKWQAPVLGSGSSLPIHPRRYTPGLNNCANPMQKRNAPRIKHAADMPSLTVTLDSPSVSGQECKVSLGFAKPQANRPYVIGSKLKRFNRAA